MYRMLKRGPYDETMRDGREQPLAGRRIVVTGAASGIGAAVAEAAARAGATVVGLDRDASAEVRVDLGEPSSVDAAVAALLAAGPVHGLANIAGLHPRQAAGNDTMRVNFLGTRHLTERLLPHLPPDGAVVVMGSSAGHAWRERQAAHRALAATPTFADGVAWLAANPVPDDVGYARSKEVLAYWARQCAARAIGRGVRVNLVAPGPVATDAFLAFREKVGNVPLADVDRVGRPGTPQEVAEVVAFLLSGAASWINGVELPIDGGLSATWLDDGRAAEPLG
jgi:NAD(P)-dependent dehydrogenase (short-subunit alcohol dehydrogenase family)